VGTRHALAGSIVAGMCCWAAACSTTNVTNVYVEGTDGAPDSPSGQDSTVEAQAGDGGHAEASTDAPPISDASAEQPVDASGADVGDSSVFLVCCPLGAVLQIDCQQDYEAGAPSQGTGPLVGTAMWHCALGEDGPFDIPCGQCEVGQACLVEASLTPMVQAAQRCQ
jgi:hypothetical protein